MVLAFGGCRIGLPAAGEGTALAEQWVKGKPTSIVSGSEESWRKTRKHGSRCY